MTTATLKQPTPSRVGSHWLSDAESGLIDRQIQNTEILTLKHQIEQQRLKIETTAKRAIAALTDGNPKAALGYLHNIEDYTLEQGRLLRDLEAAEQKDVQLAGEEAERIRRVRDVWRLYDAR